MTIWNNWYKRNIKVVLIALTKVIKELRKAKKISQVVLASALAIDQTTVSKWENGERTPDTDSLKKLAEYFCVTTDYLLGIETSESIEKEKLPADLKKILDEQQVMFDGEIVSDEEKELVKNMLTTMYGIAKKNNKRKKS